MRFLPPAIPAAQAAEQTLPDRDRVVDGVRALSLLVVVAGHAVMAVVAWPGGIARLGNLLAAYPVTQLVTWVLQIMPLFFFAGGAANAISWQRHRERGRVYPTWLWNRARRLLRPLWVYLVIVGAIAVVVTLTVATQVAAPLMLLTTQLLWFLGVYLLVTALSPLLGIASLKKAVLVLGFLVAVCAVVDVGRFMWGWPAVVGLVNFVVVWTIPALLGAMRTHGTMQRIPRWALLATVVAGLAVAGMLVATGPWPMSMVGMPGEDVSNMAPPTVVLAIHSIVIVGVVTLLDGWLGKVLARQRIWQGCVAVNLSAMTLYLWHLPMLIVLFTVTHVLGWERPTRIEGGYPVPDGWGYLLGSLVFWPVFGFLVWLIVRLLWPAEHLKLLWWDAESRLLPALLPRAATVLGAIGCVGVGICTLALSATGLGGFPTQVVDYAGLPLNAAAAMAALLASGILIRWAGKRKTESHIGNGGDTQASQ